MCIRDCLQAFEQELTPQQFATWIRPLACSNESGRLRLTAPNRFVLQWVKDRFGGRIETLARQATGEAVAVEFAIADTTTAPASKTPPAAASARVVAEPAPAAAGAINGAPGPASFGARRAEPGSLNASFTFG